MLSESAALRVPEKTEVSANSGRNPRRFGMATKAKMLNKMQMRSALRVERILSAKMPMMGGTIKQAIELKDWMSPIIVLDSPISR